MAKLARQMKLNRNHVLDSTLGHSIKFIKGEPRFVPPIMQGLALGIGAEFVDGEVAVAEEPVGAVEPTDPAERAEKLLACVYKIMERNDRGDFTAAGNPSEAAVSREFGWKVYFKEIKTVMQAYYDAEAAKRDNPQ